MVDFVKNTNITIRNNGYMPMGGMPMYGGPMMPMGGMCGPSLFGCGFGGMMPPNNSVAAGMCTGMAARVLMNNPGALKTVGKAIVWPFKMLGKGAVWTYNNALKPAGQWIWNKGLKPFGQWVGGLFSKKSAKTEES